MNNEQIKKNLIAKAKIEVESDNPQKMRDVRPSLLASLFNAYGGGCISCSGWVSEPNLSFFGFDVTFVKCFKCSNK